MSTVLRLDGGNVTSAMKSNVSVKLLTEDDHDSLQAVASFFDGNQDIGTNATRISDFVEKQAQNNQQSDDNVVQLNSDEGSRFRM